MLTQNVFIFMTFYLNSYGINCDIFKTYYIYKQENKLNPSL